MSIPNLPLLRPIIWNAATSVKATERLKFGGLELPNCYDRIKDELTIEKVQRSQI